MPRAFQCSAAGDQGQGIEPKNRREGDGLPVRGSSLPHIQCAGKRGKRHGDRRQADPDAGSCWFSGRFSHGAQLATRNNSSESAPAVVRTQITLRVDWRRDTRRWKCGCHDVPFVLLRRFSCPLGRGLHQVVAGRTLHSVLVRIVVDDRMLAAEIIERRRR